MKNTNVFNVIKDRYLLYAIMFATIVLILKLALTGANDIPDSRGYLQVVEVLQGNIDIASVTSNSDKSRFLRPLGSLVALPFSYIFGARNGFIMGNSIFYLLSVGFIFLIVKKLYSDKIALYASLLYASSPVVTTFGLAIMQDMGIWFFYLGSIFLTLWFFKEDPLPERRNKSIHLFFIGIFIGLGLLMKESVIAGYIFLCLIAFFSKYAFKYSLSQKFGIVGVVFVGILIPVIINSIVVYKYFNFSYFTWTSNLPRAELYVAAYNLVKSFIMAFNLFVPFFIIGLYKEWKRRTDGYFDIFVMIIISSSMIILGWPYFSTRFIFLMFPAIIPLAAYGISELPQFVPQRLQNDDFMIRNLDKIVLILCILANLVVAFYLGITDGGIFDQLELDLVHAV